MTHPTTTSISVLDSVRQLVGVGIFRTILTTLVLNVRALIAINVKETSISVQIVHHISTINFNQDSVYAWTDIFIPMILVNTAHMEVQVVLIALMMMEEMVF